jgi:hypothetical protein
MQRIVGVYRKALRGQTLWTYIASLGGDGSHPSLEELKKQALLTGRFNHSLIKTSMTPLGKGLGILIHPEYSPGFTVQSVFMDEKAIDSIWHVRALDLIINYK